MKKKIWFALEPFCLLLNRYKDSEVCFYVPLPFNAEDLHSFALRQI